MPVVQHARAVETGALLVEWLPEVAYRQWTLSLPVPLRWAAVRTKGFLAAVEKEAVRAVWRWQRAQARRLGVRRPLSGGAVGFLQLFGGALQLTPHFHLLLPEGLWEEDGTFVGLPPPEDEDEGAVLHRVRRAQSELERCRGVGESAQKVTQSLEFRHWA